MIIPFTLAAQLLARPIIKQDAPAPAASRRVILLDPEMARDFTRTDPYQCAVANDVSQLVRPKADTERLLHSARR